MTQAESLPLLPKPIRAERREGSYRVDATTQLSIQTSGSEDVRRLSSAARSTLNLPLPLAQGSAGIRIEVDAAQENALGREGYRLSVTAQGVCVISAQPAGAFYAIQTLRQLLPADLSAGSSGWQIPCVEIEDRPRFAWRGMMLDCCRHFWPLSFVKRFIDLIAMHRMNSFHWHLTDDQGWRIEIRKYPRLTEIGAWRRESLVGHLKDEPRRFDGQRHGGFYTQEQIREIVAYAADRYINVMPEIEMPGHARAAIAAYPELGCVDYPLEPWTLWGISGENTVNADDSTIRFFQDVLAEVVELFPSKFIHIGGDEANKDFWVNNPRIQSRIRELGLKDEHELQAWFIRQMDEFLTDRGRRLVGWDEIREGGLAAGAVVMSWRGPEGAIEGARSGHDVVMAHTKYTYLDHYQGPPETEPLAIHGFTPLEKAYAFDPIPPELTAEQARHILGLQAQLWTEYIAEPSHAEYMIFPRACALSEVMWSQPEGRDFGEFRQRLVPHLARLKAQNVNYRPLDPYPA